MENITKRICWTGCLAVLLFFALAQPMAAKTTVKYGPSAGLIKTELTSDGLKCQIMMKVFNYHNNNAHFVNNCYVYVDGERAFNIKNLWAHFSQAAVEGKEDWFNTNSSIDKIDGYHPDGDGNGFGTTFFSAACGGYCYLDNLQNKVDLTNSTWANNGTDGIKKWSVIVLHIKFNSYYGHNVKITGTWFDDCQNYTEQKTSDFEWNFNVKGCRRPKDLTAVQDGRNFNLSWDYEARSENEGYEVGAYHIYRNNEQIGCVPMYNHSFTDENGDKSCGSNRTYKVTFAPGNVLSYDKAYNATNEVNMIMDHAFDATSSITKATCTENGTYRRICSYCSSPSSKILIEEPLGHLFDNADQSKSVCTRCSHGFFHYTSSTGNALTFNNLVGMLGTDGKQVNPVSNTYDTTNKGVLEFERAIGSICPNAFNARSGYSPQLAQMTSITIPKEVTVIGTSAFEGCSGLTGTLAIPASVSSIGENAFNGCQFTALNMNSIPYVGKDAFYGLTGKKTLTLTDASAVNTASGSKFPVMDVATYSRTIKAAYEPIVLPYDFAAETGQTSYVLAEAKRIRDGKIEAKPVEGTVKAGTPVYVKSNSSVPYSFTLTTENVTPDASSCGSAAVDGFALTGTYITKDISSGYIYKDGNMVKVSGTSRVSPFQAYLEGASDVEAFAFTEYVAPAFTPGDVNDDTLVDIADVSALVSIMLGNAEATDAADVDGDTKVNFADLLKLVKMILGK